MRKITKSTLRRVIQEEIRNVLLEAYGAPSNQRLHEQGHGHDVAWLGQGPGSIGHEATVRPTGIQQCLDGSTAAVGECPPAPGGTHMPPMTIKAGKPKRGREWQRERRRINAMRKSGAISQGDWRKARRALSRTGVDAARVAMGDVENIGVPGAVKSAIEADPGGALANILKPDAGELQAKMRNAMAQADEPVYVTDDPVAP